MMLSRDAAKRLRKDLLTLNPKARHTKDLKAVLDALIIYRDLAASLRYWGTGDETTHVQYLEQVDGEALNLSIVLKERKSALDKAWESL